MNEPLSDEWLKNIERRIAALEAKIAEPHDRLAAVEDSIHQIGQAHNKGLMELREFSAKQRAVNAAMLHWVQLEQAGRGERAFDAMLESLREALK